MRLLTENLGWKILAIVIAAGLWYGFVSEQEMATSLPVAVQFQNVPSDLEMSSESLDRLFLRLRGPATRLNAASLSHVAVEFDLSQVQRPGEHTFTLGPANLVLPAGVYATRIMPSQIRITFDRRISREVPVDVRYTGPPPQGYRIARQQIVPDKVRITGPESRVSNVQAAPTDPIDLSSTISNTEFRVPAFLPDGQVRFDSEAPMVSVRVFMEKIPQ